MPDLAGNSINCTFPVSLRGSGPLTWQFTGPAPDHATIPHTFTEYDTVVPRFCGSTPTPSMEGWSVTAATCVESGWNVEFNVNHPASLNIVSASATSGVAHYGCGIATPTQMYCTGPAASVVRYPGAHLYAGGWHHREFYMMACLPLRHGLSVPHRSHHRLLLVVVIVTALIAGSQDAIGRIVVAMLILIHAI